MVFDSLRNKSAREIAQALRSNSSRCIELAEETITAINTGNTRLNAFLPINEAAVLQDARTLQGRLAGLSCQSVLAGVRFTAKDLFCNRRRVATAGGFPFSPIPGFEAPLVDADIIRAMRPELEALFIGSTKVPSGGLDWQTASRDFGITNNPWNVAFTPGGSSGDEVAAVALGYSDIGIGSDLAGSVRIPAHFTGVCSLMPSPEYAQLGGHYPFYAPQTEVQALARSGFFARTINDLEIIFSETNEQLGLETKPAIKRPSLSDYRIGFISDSLECPIASDVLSVLKNVEQTLKDGGCALNPSWPTDINPANEYELFWKLLAQTLIGLQQPGEVAELSQLSAAHAELAAVVQSWTKPELHAQAWEQKKRSEVIWNRHFDNVDVVILPVCFCSAFPHAEAKNKNGLFQRCAAMTVQTPDGDRPYLKLPYWTSFTTVAGLPVATVPVGFTTGGLPVGVQIVAKRGADLTALHVAEILQDIFGGFKAPPY